MSIYSKHQYLVARNRNLAKRIWGVLDPLQARSLGEISRFFGFSIAMRDILLLEAGWYDWPNDAIVPELMPNQFASSVIPLLHAGHSRQRYTKPGIVGDSSAMVTPTPRTSLLLSWVRRCASPRLELSIEPCVKRTVSVYAQLKNLGGRLELRTLTDPIKTRLPRMGITATRTVNDVCAINFAC